MISTLLDLNTHQLLALADAARRGALEQPIEMSLASYCPDSLRKALAGELEAVAKKGLQGEALAILLETMVHDRDARHAGSLQADLVWTGPDIPGLHSRDTRIVVHELFRKARKSVLVSTYALYDGKGLFAPLHETWEQHPGMDVRVFVDVKRGDSGSPASELIAKFKREFRTHHWPWDRLPEVYMDPRSMAEPYGERACLHAKCVVIDEMETFVTSANLTEAAQLRNIEAGLVVTSGVLACKVKEHFTALVLARALDRLF